MIAGKAYGLQKIYKQRESSKGYLNEVKLFMFEEERDAYYRKYILAKPSTRVKKVFFFEAEISNFQEIDFQKEISERNEEMKRKKDLFCNNERK